LAAQRAANAPEKSRHLGHILPIFVAEFSECFALFGTSQAHVHEDEHTGNMTSVRMVGHCTKKPSASSSIAFED
jgi:hypothetical protein